MVHCKKNSKHFVGWSENEKKEIRLTEQSLLYYNYMEFQKLEPFSVFFYFLIIWHLPVQEHHINHHGVATRGIKLAC